MIIDLDNIVLSQRVYQSWLAQLAMSAASLSEKYPNLRTDEIPDEQFRLLPNGAGEVFVRIRTTEIKMAVPADEWQYA
ncbi:hypothetical protein [Rhodoflexus sp.]